MRLHHLTYGLDLRLDHVDVQLITHIGEILQLAKTKTGNVDSLKRIQL